MRFCRVMFWVEYPISDVYRFSFDLNNPVLRVNMTYISCAYGPQLSPDASDRISKRSPSVPAVNGAGNPARLGLGAGECGERETGRRLASRASTPEGERSSVTAATGHARSS